MKRIKLFEGELKLMELVWQNDGATAKGLSVIAAEKIGWNKNTTYTVLKKLIAKGVIKREEPSFICRSLISREDIAHEEAKSVLNSFFGGSVKAMMSSFMEGSALSGDEADELRRMISEYGKKE